MSSNLDLVISPKTQAERNLNARNLNLSVNILRSPVSKPGELKDSLAREINQQSVLSRELATRGLTRLPDIILSSGQESRDSVNTKFC